MSIRANSLVLSFKRTAHAEFFRYILKFLRRYKLIILDIEKFPNNIGSKLNY